MKYDFKFTISGDTPEEIDIVLDWCNENFEFSQDYDTHVKQFLYNKLLNEEDNEHRWTYLKFYQNNTTIKILFRDEIDAMAFRLRWS